MIQRRLGYLVFFTASCCGLLAVMGCSSAPETDAATDKQNAALRDPMGYKAFDGSDANGNGMGDIGSRTMKQDLHDVFDP